MCMQTTIYAEKLDRHEVRCCFNHIDINGIALWNNDPQVRFRHASEYSQAHLLNCMGKAAKARKAILISHLIGQVRSFVALGAGMTRMKYVRFLGYEVMAASLWNSAFCLLGYLLAAEVDRLRVLIERSGWGIIGVLVLLFLAWRFFRQRMKQRIRQDRRTSRRQVKSAV